MCALEVRPLELDIVAAGVDWLTCTAKHTEHSIELDRLSMAEINDQYQSGGKVRPASLLGFEGSRAEHIFFGRREHDVMLQCSGEVSSRLAVEACKLASNVSRLDLQVTVYSGGEVLDLAADTDRHLLSSAGGNGRPKSWDIILNRPVGQTLMINKRIGDNHGRIYDKGVESNCGPPGMLWRYEIELKRKVAQRAAAACVRFENPKAVAIDSVHRWMAQRDCRPPWSAGGNYAYVKDCLAIESPDILTWFRSSVSKSVSRAILEYGLELTLDSLGLRAHCGSQEGKDNVNG